MTLHRSLVGLFAVVLAVTGCSAGAPSATSAGPSAAPDRPSAATGSPGPRLGGPAAGRAVQVGRLWFDAMEVTVGQVRAFAAESSLRTAAEREGGGFEFVGGWTRRPGWTYLAPYGRPARADEPAVHLSWAEAQEYCRWAGGRLPTGAEWRAAAYTEARENPPMPYRSGQTYDYPTGTAPEPANTEGDADGFATAAPGGSLPAAVNGLHDMGANVWEWLDDARDGDRLVAGGSWWYGPEQMTADAFQYKAATFYAVYVGFRCVYDTPPASGTAR